jgi:hypothetical protein
VKPARRWKINFFDRRRDPVWFELWKLYSYCAVWVAAILLAFYPFVLTALGIRGLSGIGAAHLPTVAAHAAIIAAFGFLDYFLVLMPFEWYFHRYLFHRQAIFLGRPNKLRQAHVDHHTDHDDDHYDTRTVEQTFKAHFPGKALPGFGVLFCLPILLIGLLIHAIVPAYPLWFVWCTTIGMGFGVAFGYGRYEGRYHAQDHRPVEWWVPRMEDPKRGAYWRQAYAEHRAHHRYPGVNEAVFARDGNSWPSRVFRTYMEADVAMAPDANGVMRVVLENDQPKMTYGSLPDPLPWVKRLDVKHGEAFPRTPA